MECHLIALLSRHRWEEGQSSQETGSLHVSSRSASFIQPFSFRGETSMLIDVPAETSAGDTRVAVTPKTAKTSLLIGVPKETAPGEKRVATVPEVVEKLIKLGFSVAVESGAGDAANCGDDTYRAAGGQVVPTAAALWAQADIVLKVRAPSPQEVGLMREGQTLIGFIWPAQNPELMQQLAAKKATVLAIDSLPRTLSRAQKMDALTSQAG